MASTGEGRHTASIDDIEEALKAVIRQGLPVTDDSAGELLPNLRCVYARAVHPRSRLSRITALDEVLRALLDDLGPNPPGEASHVLFAAEATRRGTTLTQRREWAAAALDRHVDHFRQHIEPKLRRTVAEQLQQLNLRYAPRRQGARPPAATSGSTPALTEADYTELEELVSRIWTSVYAVRAELIAVRRLVDEGATAADREERSGAALWHYARLLTALEAYLDRYGETILHGELEYAAESVIALAGWHPELTPKEAQQLRYALARGDPDDKEGFLGRLKRSKQGKGMFDFWARG